MNLLQLPVLFFSLFYVPIGIANLNFNADKDLIGEAYHVLSQQQDTLLTIGRRNGMGYREMRLANPEIDIFLPGQGTPVLIPGKFILPNVERHGIVINLAERRLYYFGKDSQVVTYPIGIGRQGWQTPTGDLTIKSKHIDPSWHPPESIRQAYAKKGKTLPEIVEAGPDNPLGKYALRLSWQHYLIHGTNKPNGVGMRVSHGCIRLFPEDIKTLFEQVETGTPVRVIDQPFKAGWHGNQLFLEVHPVAPDSEHINKSIALTETLIQATRKRSADIDWQRVDAIAQAGNGIPQAVGYLLHQSERQRIETSDLP